MFLKKIGSALLATILIFFFSFIVISPIIEKLGYSSVEGSYHAVTHAILVSLIFTVLICTIVIIEEINKIKK
ncbi:MAG: hypothetical protein GX752_03460 [Clostridium sp.]|nr:hypothetical protein [Clostridium sp.]